MQTPPQKMENIGLVWLVRMRWVLIATLLGALLAQKVDLTVGVILLAFGAVSNLALRAIPAGAGPLEFRAMAALEVMDAVALTWLLAGTGGPANPFSTLYLVYISLAALLLPPWALVAVGLVSLAGYGLLFRVVDMASLHGPGAFEDHLRGMWFPFAVSAALIGGFVFATRKALRAKEIQLTRLQERAARMDRLAALSTLAAGAAHELGTPLASIQTAGRELERVLANTSLHADTAVELQTLRASVVRCRDILARLSRSGGRDAGETPEDLRLGDLWARALSLLPPNSGAQVHARLLEDLRVHVPPAATAETLKNLVQNALEASPVGKQVMVECLDGPLVVEITVQDDGGGLPDPVKARLGEPFVTGKPDGMGLGLYLAFELARHLGGNLRVVDVKGGGTRVSLDLPKPAASSPPA